MTTERAPVRRLLHGMGQVARAWRALVTDPAARARYAQVVGLQVLAVVVLAATCGPSVAALAEGIEFGEDGHLKLDMGDGGAWSVVYGTLCAVEWFVVALSRDFHDELSRTASRLVGVPPEDEAQRPARVRLDPGWVWRKVKRRRHGAVVFALGYPLLSLLLLVPRVGDALHAGAAAAWGAYWLCVFTLGKTAFAWTDEAPPDPWFLRLCSAAQREIPLLRRWLPAALIRAWRRHTGVALRPAALVERMPWEAAGLACVRLLGGIPGIYLLVRPLIPVAATAMLQERGLIATTGPGVTPASAAGG